MPLTRTDAKKLEAERVQAILIELLREEENKYCADCEAKQPRWASWNLGVFLCIRCAGIHRNLGVHLTKVKSVNLDSWTPEQVQSMRVMGNKMARRVYEAELPEHFRRPQTYSALESFIRAKYEQKRYILKDWSPPPIDIKDLPLPLNKRHSSDRDLRPNMRKIDQNSDLFSKTRSIACNINVLKATIDAKSGIVSDVPPLLDLNPPKSPIEVDKGGIHLNNTTTGVSEDDCMEDFGPVVAAPPPNYHPDIFVTDAVPSSSNDKADIVISVSENNMEDLASVLEPKPTISEKKSTSDILALYGTAPKFYARIARQHGMEQFSEAPGEAIAFNEAENSIHSSDTSSPCYVPSVISVSQPNASPSGFTQLGYFGSGANTISMRNFFLNHETATLFASASPFANVPIATTTNGVFSNSKTVPVEHMDISCSTALETRNSLDRFVTDLNCLNINGKSGERNNL